MSDGKIFVAKRKGVYVLKLIGDVRLTLSATLDEFLEGMISEPDLTAVFIDLSDTEAIDSTTLGFLAKIAILTRKNFQWAPTLISVRDDITRILLSMGFDQVFSIIRERLDREEALEELPELQSSEQEIKDKVLEAHRILMGLNEANRSKFQGLVTMLEAS